jgi:lipid II isoglutaminyl synthase (glutamine-hydrolysing)
MLGQLDRVLAIYLAKLSSILIKLLGIGKASSFPGRLALKLEPNLLKHFADELNSNHSNLSFFITGTNGKSTTTGMLKSICEQYKTALRTDPKLICNDIGANLIYGIVSELIKASDHKNNLDTHDYILEIDEAALEGIALELKPRSITVTNIYRDQLDRFGEVDATQRLISRGIKNAASDNTKTLVLILNCNDKKVLELRDLLNDNQNIQFVYYQVIDAREIDNLENNYTAYNKHSAILTARIINENINHSQIKLTSLDGKSIELRVPVPGLYNVHNAVAAASSAFVQGISLEIIAKGIEGYQSLFGRSETVQYKDSSYKVFLIKNPTGCTEVLRLLSNAKQANYLIAINDNYADGRDVSWLWDAKFELLQTTSKVICSGSRAYDIALRLKYAGLEEGRIIIEPKINKALELATSEGSELFVLPTYTALLELNKMGFGI